MNKSQFGVFEKEGGSGPTVIKPGRDFGKGKDPRSLNQSGVYAEKDAQIWKEMAKSSGDRDAEWSGTPSDESSEIVGAPTGASKKASETPKGTQGQHWRGEPWAKNPKVGGKETETGSGTSGQHWRGEDMPVERGAGTGTGTDRESSSGKGVESSKTASDRPDEG